MTTRTADAHTAPEETHQQIEARLIAKYGKQYARGLDQAEYLRQRALLVAPPRPATPVIGKHVREMTDAEYKAGLQKLGIYRR